jgi:hypothetical protein
MIKSLHARLVVQVLILSVMLVLTTATVPTVVADCQRFGSGDCFGCTSIGPSDCSASATCCRCYCAGGSGPDIGEICSYAGCGLCNLLCYF